MQHRSEETRARIITSAAELFARNGYDATGVAEICAAAGVSKGAFYHHFETKQSLFLTLLDAWLQNLESQFSTVAAKGGTVPESLTGMALGTSDLISLVDAHLPLFLEFWVQAKRKPEVWKLAITPYYRFQKFFQLLIEKGQTEGTIDPMLSASSVSRMIIGMAMGILLQVFVDPDGADWQAAIQEAIHVLLRGATSQGA